MTSRGGLRKPFVIPTASAIANTAAIAPPASAALTIGRQRRVRRRAATKYQANTLTTQAVITTSKTIASARRRDAVIASPVAMLDHSHAEDLGVARLDLLALRLHLGGIGLEQFQADSGMCSPFSLTCAWNERCAKTSTSICWASALKKKLWNSLAAFGFGALRKMPDGTMISGEPSVG